MRTFVNFTLTIGAAALLSSCAGSQPPIGAPGAMPQTALNAHHNASALSHYGILYSFGGTGDDGKNPYSGFIDVDGILYGTTASGGQYNDGSVIEITRTGKERVLYSFDKGAGDGARPLAPLIESRGVFYGITAEGGDSSSDGTVFALTKSGVEHVLYRFEGGEEGSYPDGGLVQLNGVMYGTTLYGGCNGDGCGTVYSIDPAGHERTVFRFNNLSTGLQPMGLVVANGELYGTTEYGGEGNGYAGSGTVFELSTSGKERVLYDFKGYPSDGLLPIARPIFWSGRIYGTTGLGGDGDCEAGCGTVFELTLSGKEKVLYSFQKADGAEPAAPLLVVNGVLYGTTLHGGDESCRASSYGEDGCGTVFELTTSGKQSVLHAFTGPTGDGAAPEASLVSFGGALYGTTSLGGLYNYGAVFRIKP
jgi:uncharacterized repeat protein (TIGR03803 family)